MLIGPEHKVVRGSIGIQFQSVIPAAVHRQYGFENGVMVAQVTPGAGAAKAGIQPDDIITSIDGRSIKNGDDLVADISARRVGSSVKLGYLRNGKPETASVTIGDRAKLYSDNGNAPDNDTPQESDAGQGKLGITVTTVPPALASKLNLKGGVQVNSIRPGSFADEIGLSKGHIIVSINKRPITDESSYKAVVSTLKPGEDVVFVVRAPAGPNTGNTFLGGTLPQ
jgi:serine protease Do